MAAVLEPPDLLDGVFGNLKNFATGNIHRGYMQFTGRALVTLGLTTDRSGPTSHLACCIRRAVSAWSAGRRHT